MLKHMKNFSIQIYIILLGNLLSRFSFFMLWPFLSVILYQKFQLGEITIGLIICLSTAISVFLAFNSGILSDYIGRRCLLFFGIFIAVFGFLFAFFSDSNALFTYIILLACISLSDGFMGPMQKTLISDTLEDTNTRKYAFYVFYYCSNIAGAIGPFAGLKLALNYPKILFIISVFAYLSVFILYILFSVGKTKTKNLIKSKNSIKQTLSILKNDATFVWLMLANILMFLIYAQIDSTLAQYFARENNENLIHFYAYFLMANTILIILFQFPTLRFIERFSINYQIYLGIFLFFIAQIFFALTPTNSYTFWLTGMVFLTFGEIILFSLINIMIDKLAPTHLRGAYFGASSFFRIGVILAPYIGSALLYHFNRSALFITMSIFCMLIWLCYKQALKKEANIINNWKSFEDHTELTQ